MVAGFLILSARSRYRSILIVIPMYIEDMLLLYNT